MSLRTTLLLGTLPLLSIGVACRDIAGPSPARPPAPTRVSTTLGAPDMSYFVMSDMWYTRTLSQFPWDTWVTLEATGSVTLVATTPISGHSSYYVFPGGPVGVTGRIDPHPNGETPCVLNLSLSDGYGPMPSWGPCEAPAKIDTVLYRRLAAPTAKRGPLPYKHFYDCSTWSDVCHSTISGEYSEIHERPVPVVINKLTASQRLASFASPVPITFRASKTPDSIHVGGAVAPHPMAITLWQWIGADSTRNPDLAWAVCHSNGLMNCTYNAYESGRMTVKAFVGGWEQTSYTSVECLVSSGDSSLNDTTDDFKVREEILNMLARSNADSSSFAGWNASNPNGWRHETNVATWRLPGGGYQAVPYDLPGSTACGTPSGAPLTPPVPGATLYSWSHDHPTPKGQRLYCPGRIMFNGVEVQRASRPGDVDPATGQLRPWQVAAKDDDSTVAGSVAGSRTDWSQVQMPAPYLRSFIMSYDGTVYQLAQWPGPPYPRFWMKYRAFGGSPSERKCAWVKKYTN